MQLEVSHFRIFVSRAWAHIPIEKRKALEPQSKSCMFVGYSDEFKGYRLLDIHTKELFIERSVKFDEDILHALPDELVTKFPSPLNDEYADETLDHNFDEDEPLPVTHFGPPVVKHRDHTSSCSSEDS